MDILLRAANKMNIPSERPYLPFQVLWYGRARETCHLLKEEYKDVKTRRKSPRVYTQRSVRTHDLIVPVRSKTTHPVVVLSPRLHPHVNSRNSSAGSADWTTLRSKHTSSRHQRR